MRKKKQQESLTATRLRERFKWRKINRPRVWTPKEHGEELLGYYGGRTMRTGRFGQYEVVLVHVPGRGTATVSGVQIIQLIDAAAIPRGHPIRIVWQGFKELSGDQNMKCFELLVAEGDPLDPQTQAELDQLVSEWTANNEGEVFA